MQSSVQEAAAKFNKSPRTIQRWIKSGKLVAQTVNGKVKYDLTIQPIGGLNPTQTISTNLPPPAGGSWIVNPVQIHTGVITGGKRFYVPSDLAVITSRDNARSMWNNLVIREALQSRLWAAAEQSGHVEPEDPKDKRQLKVASEIQKVIDNIPNLLKLKYSLLKSRWFGCYGAMLKYRWKAHRLAVADWSPVHGDSILFAQDNDDIAVYTTIGGGVGVKPVTSEAGYIGRAHVIEDDRQIEFDDRGLPYQRIGTHERDAFLLMAYDPDPTDFLEIRRSGAVKGLGIRSTVYPTWYAAQEVLGNLMDWLERIGTGLTIYKFLRGNEASYNAAKELAESQSNQAVMLIPVDPEMNSGRPVEGVERIEPSAVGLDNMLKVVEDLFNSQIRRFIVGQDSTSRPVSSGLNSNLADIHENTFSRIVAFDCQDLAQCLTHQLVRVLHKWNHPDDLDFTCKYVIDYDSSDVDKQMQAIKTAWEMGVGFDADEVRSLTGMSKPDLDAVVLKKNEGQQAEHAPEQGQQEGTDEQAETAATGELAQTVGGLTAISALQQSYYEGKIPQEACIANVVLLFGFSREQAASLFPEIPPEKLTEDEGQAPPEGAAPEAEAPPEEGLELFRYASEDAPDPDVQLLAVAEILTSEADDDQKRGAIYSVLGKEAE